VEVRYALANWGKIPLNPTLYGEWNFNDNAPDVWELKLALGQTFGHRWNWAANVTYEHENGGAREHVFEMSSALTYALIDQTLNVGVEALVERATEAESRSDPAYEFLIGPSVNVRPTRNTRNTLSRPYHAISWCAHAISSADAGLQRAVFQRRGRAARRNFANSSPHISPAPSKDRKDDSGNAKSPG
jgi:outer membrane putative beta-barrel porin/alpha-amylase